MVRPFRSKRNQVFWVDGQVEKHCHTPADAWTEYEKLTQLRAKGVAVPQAQPPDGEILRLEYIPGETIPDFLETTRSLRDLQEAAVGLAVWFASFYRAVEHEATGEIHSDVNGRNFILANACVWGVDFETVLFGKIEQNLGALLAFVESYRLGDRGQQLRFAEILRHSFIEYLDANPILMEDERKKELFYLGQRRR